MKYIKFFILTLSILLLTGCWNYRELEDLLIVSALGIDSNEDGFDISVEVINDKMVSGGEQSGGSSSEETPIVVYSSKAKTIREAIDKIILESPKRLYLGHMNLLVISEDIAKKGINEFLDYFMRDTEIRKTFFTTVVKNAKASDVLKILQPIENITAVSIQSSLEIANVYYGEFSNQTLEEIVRCLFTTGRNPTIAAIEVTGDVKKGSKNDNVSTTSPKTSIKVKGTTVFKGDKLVGYLNEKEAIYYAVVRDKIDTISLSFPCDKKDNYANIIIDGVKGKLKATVDKDEPKIAIDIAGNAAITEFNCKIDLKKPSNIKKIEEIANKEIVKQMKKTVKKVKELNSDIFGFEEQFYRNHYKYWKKKKDKWDELFKDIEVKVKSDIKIERISSSVETAKSR